MNIQDCITFANDHPIASVATVDGDQPRVRIFLMWYADETGFYFITLSPKEIHKQLSQNPKVEVCFYNNAADLGDAKMMRVTGAVECLNDPETVEKAYQTRVMLESIVGRSVRPYIVPFRIATGVAHFWTMADILKEPELERIEF